MLVMELIKVDVESKTFVNTSTYKSKIRSPPFVVL